ncbi:dihydropteroate synthase [Trichocoleus sp. ST-U2]|uniref:dihydropteroate synthase n=1 Tax=Coleofasciculus sp. FACHB-SPT9 TaxID=2692791 RepID=UPI0016834124|nr:dihydropteroate synthase [Coleofasciculus sp. FACHB-SPT9]MBD1890751.1 dihydropteroate synthase [Coleofasciculus sp. FACHB-SPT9]
MNQSKIQNSLTLRGQTFDWGQRTYLMGVLNVTPDSFSDGGDFNTLGDALAQAKHLVAAGANILDVGGQSTRPGAAQISLEEELDRVLPVVQALRKGAEGRIEDDSDSSVGVIESAQHSNPLSNPPGYIPPPSEVPISVDTTRASVAQAAVAAGADIVNDISGGTFDPEMFAVVAELGVPIVLMHIRGTPATMQQMTNYQDLMGEISEFLSSQIEQAIASGIARSKIIIDPGIGFAKTYEQSLEILQRLPMLHSLGVPLLVGPSRKSFIGRILNQPDPKARVWGTAAACCGAIAGGADILRIHDVQPMHDVCRVADAIFRKQK